ncbi:hypothetical protein QQF64_005687 [Cirrhinus molitorella]|uniref:Uncharacterized protein n=1 Tax=Cirrhinus molitorella TaxID=172907 RepID=A0ABR3MCW8_9TELE
MGRQSTEKRSPTGEAHGEQDESVFRDGQVCSAHLNDVHWHRRATGSGERVPAVLFYPWAWNHIKVEQHASVGGKGFKPQGQGSSEEQKRPSQER